MHTGRQEPAMRITTHDHLMELLDSLYGDGTDRTRVTPSASVR